MTSFQILNVMVNGKQRITRDVLSILKEAIAPAMEDMDPPGNTAGALLMTGLIPMEEQLESALNVVAKKVGMLLSWRNIMPQTFSLVARHHLIEIQKISIHFKAWKSTVLYESWNNITTSISILKDENFMKKA